MKRLLLISATAALAAVPASIGLWGNQSFAEEVPVSVPARATLVATSSPAKPTHEPTHAEPGDDHRGTTATHAEPGDDHRGTTATHAEPGDDHRGTTATHAEPGDDHGGSTGTRSSSSRATSDDNGSRPDAGDDKGGGSGRSGSGR